MAKDVTIRVTGQNADGTLNVQIPDGGNPFPVSYTHLDVYKRQESYLGESAQ